MRARRRLCAPNNRQLDLTAAIAREAGSRRGAVREIGKEVLGRREARGQRPPLRLVQVRRHALQLRKLLGGCSDKHAVVPGPVHEHLDV